MTTHTAADPPQTYAICRAGRPAAWGEWPTQDAAHGVIAIARHLCASSGTTAGLAAAEEMLLELEVLPVSPDDPPPAAGQAARMLAAVAGIAEQRGGGLSSADFAARLWRAQDDALRREHMAAGTDPAGTGLIAAVLVQPHVHAAANGLALLASSLLADDEEAGGDVGD